QRADDPLGHAVLLTERASDGDRELSHLERARVGPVEGGQILRIDLKDSDVIFGTGADDARVVLLRLVTQDDLQLARIFYHVVIGDDVPIRADDEPGPDAVLLLLDDVWHGNRGLDLDDGLSSLRSDTDDGRFLGQVVGDGWQRRHHDGARGRPLDQPRR